METTPIKAVEMVRAIRDAFYEHTKDFSDAELRAYIASEAAAFRREMETSKVEKPEASGNAGGEPALSPEFPAKLSA
jgi:protein-disulfide isomerase-like protein with CxxC motif